MYKLSFGRTFGRLAKVIKLALYLRIGFQLPVEPELDHYRPAPHIYFLFQLHHAGVGDACLDMDYHTVLYVLYAQAENKAKQNKLESRNKNRT